MISSLQSGQDLPTSVSAVELDTPTFPHPIPKTRGAEYLLTLK
jgi:hypothetical protein